VLAAAFAPAMGVALVSRVDGTLEHYTYPEFMAWSPTYRLQQPAYRMALDAQHCKLFVAASPATALRVNSYGDRPLGQGDIHVYDIRTVLDGKAKGGTLKPQATIPVGRNISHLLYSPHHNTLYYLADGPDTPILGRVPMADVSKARRVPLPGATGLCLTPD